MPSNPREPRVRLDTHEVANQSEPLLDVNLYAADRLLRSMAEAVGAGEHGDRLSAFGAAVGSESVQRRGDEANRHPPRLCAFDRFGRRIDEVEYHPSYHALMRLSVEAGTSAIAWSAPRAGHVAHSVLLFLLTQADAGHGCPLSMTYAAVPALRREPEVAAEWVPRVLASHYDPRCIPAPEKAGVTIGMAMTEKQGGSDVRANRTLARPQSDGSYLLEGHKWFCSAPMCDAFLTLAHVDGAEDGLTCFLTPRWRPDGSRNVIEIQRLKDKLGDRSNASSEIEYRGAWATRVGPQGRGIPTILEMVQHTRLDCVTGAAATMRWSVSHALWHAQRRSAFGRRLIDHALMRVVLADLVLESAAAVALSMRVASAFDGADADPAEAALSRVATPLAKYWVCKRCPVVVAEAMECLGGSGYVEEAPLARAFRQSPLNGIWEGSGNVIALDLLRVVDRDPAAIEALQASMRRDLPERWRDRSDDVCQAIAGASAREARWHAERVSVMLAGAALARLGQTELAEDWLLARAGPSVGLAFGASPIAAPRADALVEAGALDA